MVTWFYALTGIIQIVTNYSNNIWVYLLLIVFSLFLLFIDDYSLSELNSKYNKEAAAVAVNSHIT